MGYDLPLIVLAALAATSGFLKPQLFEGFISLEAAHSHHHSSHLPASIPTLTSTLVVLSSVLALGFYWERLGIKSLNPVYFKKRFPKIYNSLFKAFYQDHLQLVLVDLTRCGAAVIARFTDEKGIEGIVEAITSGTFGAGNILRKIQTGLVQNYIALFALGIALLTAFAGISGGWLI